MSVEHTYCLILPDYVNMSLNNIPLYLMNEYTCKPHYGIIRSNDSNHSPDSIHYNYII